MLLTEFQWVVITHEEDEKKELVFDIHRLDILEYWLVDLVKDSILISNLP